MRPHTAPGLLRVTLSEKLSPDTLWEIHSRGLAAEIPAALREVLATAGCMEMTGVYRLKPEEVYHDKYGFSREFKVVLKTGFDVNESVKALTASPFVENVKTVAFRSSNSTE